MLERMEAVDETLSFPLTSMPPSLSCPLPTHFNVPFSIFNSPNTSRPSFSLPAARKPKNHRDPYFFLLPFILFVPLPALLLPGLPLLDLPLPDLLTFPIPPFLPALFIVRAPLPPPDASV
jgi:hypothetical protein